jgi:hypothetical protein
MAGRTRGRRCVVHKPMASPLFTKPSLPLLKTFHGYASRLEAIDSARPAWLHGPAMNDSGIGPSEGRYGVGSGFSWMCVST